MSQRSGSPSRRTRTRAASSTPPGAAAIRVAHRRLEKRFGPLDPPRPLDPLEELVLTVLSQNTSDVNRDRAYASLTERFPTWQAVLKAPTVAVADAIRPGGLANTKAPRIQAILRAIEERQGRLDLTFLHRMSDGEVREYLESLPGVGPKTAACVLAFSLERPALPVDTHVFRTAQRLGYLPPKTTAVAAHAVMEQLVPPKLRVRMHVGLIRLGREICKPGRPRCEECPLLDVCPTGRRLTLSG
ncbi:MAG: endonuclease III [Actinomycetota bacterium]